MVCSSPNKGLGCRVVAPRRPGQVQHRVDPGYGGRHPDVAAQVADDVFDTVCVRMRVAAEHPHLAAGLAQQRHEVPAERSRAPGNQNR